MKHEQRNDQLLTSWKEIAAHLGKGVRTAQRWEREIGLPVRRPAENRHIVVALATDLDNWIAHGINPAYRNNTFITTREGCANQRRFAGRRLRPADRFFVGSQM